MKLIRLTSSSDTGIVENNFKEDIKIEENSQIALVNSCFSVSDEKFDLDTNNDEIKYKDTLTSETNAILTKTTYTKTTGKELLEDITDKTNGSLIETSRNIGSQFLMDIQGGKALAEMKISPNDGNLYQNFFTTPNGVKTNDVDLTKSVNNISLLRINTSSNDDTQHIASFSSWGKGYSTLRVQIERLETNVDTDQNGFIMGLSNKNPKDWSLDVNDNLPFDDKTYYFRVGDPSLAIHLFTKNKGDLGERDDGGVSLDKTGNNATPNANYIQIDKNGTNMEWKVFRSSQATPDIIRTEVIANPNEDLYPFVILRGNTTKMKLSNVKYTLDPYKTDLSNYLNPVESEDYTAGLGAKPTQIKNSRNTNKTFEFQSIILANFLGFKDRVLTNQAGTRGEFKHKAEDQYRILIENPYFVIKLSNINLDSYDGENEGRYNILSTFGNEVNTTHSVFYEANNPVFLDLKNSSSRSIRNIRCEILNADLTRTITDGFISLTLLVK